jgi:hypothetical protein
MKSRSRKLTLATVVLAGLFPAAAAAMPVDAVHVTRGGYIQNGGGGGGYVLNAFSENAHGQSLPSSACGKDYSRNSVDGNYCATRHTTPVGSSPPVSSAPAKVVAGDNGFAWGDAAAGAGAALGIVLIGTGTTTAVRRRRTQSQPSRPAISS